jgi:tRNA modification GTPase
VIAVAGPGQEFVEVPAGAEVVFVRTKLDLLEVRPSGFAISANTGQGMAELLAVLTDMSAKLTEISSPAALARPRQVACLRDTEAALGRALVEGEPELRGEELRAAAHALARLTGVIGVEEVLDAVFSSFCIGK